MEYLSKVVLSGMPIGTKINGIELTQEMKDFLEKGNLKVSFSSEYFIDIEFKVIPDLIYSLLKRNWIVVKASNEQNFITSDNPVSLTWKNENMKLPPGFDCPNTQVIFPLSKHIALIGDFEEKEAIIHSTPLILASINTCTYLSAERFIYSPHEDFYIIKAIENRAIIEKFKF